MAHWKTVRWYAPNGSLAREKNFQCIYAALASATGWASHLSGNDAVVRDGFQVVWGTCDGMPGQMQIVRPSLGDAITRADAPRIEGRTAMPVKRKCGIAQQDTERLIAAMVCYGSCYALTVMKEDGDSVDAVAFDRLRAAGDMLFEMATGRKPTMKELEKLV